MKWPENKKSYVKMSEICGPLRRAFDQAVSLKRCARDTPLDWDGFDTIPSMEAMTVAPSEMLSDMLYRDNRRIDGGDVLDILIQLSVMMGIEQGRRMERIGL